MAFQLLKPIERASVSTTCKKWYDLITNTKAFWREVEVEEDDSKEKMNQMLQVFSSRSSSSLKSVKVKRRIETEEELREIFSLIEPSASTIKALLLKQSRDLNSLTKDLSQDLPNLQVLFSIHTTSDRFEKIAPVKKKSTGLRIYCTDTLESLQDEEMKWLSQLEHLQIHQISSDTQFSSILRSCKRLLSFSAIEMKSRDAKEPESITTDCLKSLGLPLSPPNQPAVSLKILASSLSSLRCRIDQLEGIKTTTSLRQLLLILEEGDDWSQVQATEYTENLKRSLLSWPSIVKLKFGVTTAKVQTQLQVLSQALLCSRLQEQSAVLPELEELELKLKNEPDLDALARLVISRERYRTTDSKPFILKLLVGRPGNDAQIMEKFAEAKKRIQEEEKENAV